MKSKFTKFLILTTMTYCTIVSYDRVCADIPDCSDTQYHCTWSGGCNLWQLGGQKCKDEEASSGYIEACYQGCLIDQENRKCGGKACYEPKEQPRLHIEIDKKS